MYYEVKLKVQKEITRPGRQPKVAEVKEHYLVDAASFAEAEFAAYLLYKETPVSGSVDVFAVSRSRVREVVNTKTDGAPFFKAIVSDTFLDEETGKEKPLKYQMLVCAANVDEATLRMNDHIKQGYDMRLDEIRRTDILEVIRFERWK